MEHSQQHSCQKFSGEETLWRQPRRARRRMPLSLTGAIDVISAIQADFAVQKVGLKYIFEYFISPCTGNQTAESLLLEMAGSIGWLMASIYISLDVRGIKGENMWKPAQSAAYQVRSGQVAATWRWKRTFTTAFLSHLHLQCNAFLSHMQYPSCTFKCTALHCCTLDHCMACIVAWWTESKSFLLRHCVWTECLIGIGAGCTLHCTALYYFVNFIVVSNFSYCTSGSGTV